MTRINLQGIDTDVQMMKEAAGLMGFDEIKILMDGDATLSNIKQAFEQWLIKGTGPDDRALFYFSGHGTQKTDVNGDEPDQLDEVLVCHDAGLSEETLVNGFDDDTFGNLISRVPAKEIFIFIDACHSGSATKDIILSSVGDVPKFFYYKGVSRGRAEGSFASVEAPGHVKFMGLSACQDNESALASPRGSYFTKGVLSHVKFASNRGQALTFIELKDKVGSYILENVAKKSQVFHPQISGNLSMAKDVVIIPVEQPGGIWAELEGLVAQANYEISINTNKTRFDLGDLLQITCDLTHDGYLNILSVNPGDTTATVLFPNKSHKDNFVQRGNRITIPAQGDTFELFAKLPRGRGLIAVFHTRDKINAYQEAGGKDFDLFRQISPGSLQQLTRSVRGFGVRETTENSPGMGAGKVITYIE